MATRHRPRRGSPNPIVSGDTGTYGGPQGGARVKDLFRESGDLESREYGVPQADIPGGKTHVVNPETHADKPPGVPERPADYHKYHGVESDDGPYETPSPEVGPPQPKEPTPHQHWAEAIPVKVVQNPDRPKVLRRAVAETITCVSSAVTSEPTRICGRDPYRDEIMLLCTDASNDILFAYEQATLLEGRGATLKHTATSYTRIATQDFLYAWSANSTATSALSVVIVTETQL